MQVEANPSVPEEGEEEGKDSFAALTDRSRARRAALRPLSPALVQQRLSFVDGLFVR